jgi:nicotinamidase-related amidase
MPRVTCDDGRSFAFEPASTAMLVIDFQRDFVDPEGGCRLDEAERKRLAAVMPAAREAVVAARAAGIAVIHTRESYSADGSDINPLKREMGYVGREGPLGRSLIRGEPGCDFATGMAPAPGERVVDKAGFSAFYGTDLEAHLRARGVASLIILGITYNCCVHSTLRDAVERGYRCLTLDDCCAATSANLEEAVRAVIRGEGNLFGWIGDGRAFCDALA